MPLDHMTMITLTILCACREFQRCRVGLSNRDSMPHITIIMAGMSTYAGTSAVWLRVYI